MNSLILEAESLTTELSMSVNKARCISDDITNYFFGDADVDTNEGRAFIAYGLGHAQTQHEIVVDYIIDIENKLNRLTEIIDKMYLKKKGINKYE